MISHSGSSYKCISAFFGLLNPLVTFRITRSCIIVSRSQTGYSSCQNRDRLRQMCMFLVFKDKRPCVTCSLCRVLGTFTVCVTAPPFITPRCSFITLRCRPEQQSARRMHRYHCRSSRRQSSAMAWSTVPAALALIPKPSQS